MLRESENSKLYSMESNSQEVTELKRYVEELEKAIKEKEEEYQHGVRYLEKENLGWYIITVSYAWIVLET